MECEKEENRHRCSCRQEQDQHDNNKMGLVEASTEVEAYIESIEESIQFLLEEANGADDEITVILYKRELVKWLNGELETNWNQRFTRNKAIKLKNEFELVKFLFRSENDFKKKDE
ncbi:hypothetical protein PIB30_036669 [Stylosanthes scabra]|uniref:Uncharacterized protein n=1 Tax=Stylosanthes scabra TaxID=79078 RepID=A0ABU6WGF3_9FABA|nr:hypothetical protein [Stylosanthes scabra]